MCRDLKVDSKSGLERVQEPGYHYPLGQAVPFRNGLWEEYHLDGYCSSMCCSFYGSFYILLASVGR